MDAIVTGKFIRVFLAVIFLAGIISVAFCLTGNFTRASACCHNKMQAAAKDSEDCLSHCAKQKTFALKTEAYSQEGPEIKALFSVKPEAVLFLKNSTPRTSATTEFYRNEAIPELPPNQAYLSAYFTLAPPIVR